MAGERRKDYMVSKRVHLLYLVTWVSSLLLVGALFGLAIKLRGISQALPAGEHTSFIVVGVLAFVIVCASLFLAVYTIVHTHRLMGSAYRIGVVLKEVNAGEIGRRANLRDGDFFLEIADEINVLAGKIEAWNPDKATDAAGEAPAGEAPAGEADAPAAEAKATDAEGASA